MKKLLIPLSLMTLALIPGCMADKPANVNENIAKTLSSNISQIMESIKYVNDIDENKLLIDELHSKTITNQDYSTGTENINNIPKIPPKTISDGLVKRNTTKVYPARRVSANNTFFNQNNNTAYSPIKNQTTKGDYVSDAGVKTNRAYTAQYNPRYTLSTSSNTTQLTSYMEKIQDLYTICNDTCAASYDLESLKTELLTSCNNCKNLLDKVNQGKISLTDTQTKTLKEYNDTLQGCINDLKSCKSCADDVNIINSLKGNFSNNCDTLVAKYLKVLNNLDTNNSYCNNAKCTVAEINNYIAGITNDNSYVNKSYQSRYVIYDEDNQPNNYINKTDNINNQKATTPSINNTSNTTTNNSTSLSNTNNISNTSSSSTTNNTTQQTNNNIYSATSATNKATSNTTSAQSQNTPNTMPAQTSQNNSSKSYQSAQYTSRPYSSPNNPSTTTDNQSNTQNNAVYSQSSSRQGTTITQPIRPTNSNNSLDNTRKSIQSRQNSTTTQNATNNRTFDIKENERNPQQNNYNNNVPKPAPHRTKDIKDADYRYINGNKGIKTLEETQHNEVSNNNYQASRNVNTYTPSPRRNVYTQSNNHRTTEYRTTSTNEKRLTGYTNNNLKVDNKEVRAGVSTKTINAF